MDPYTDYLKFVGDQLLFLRHSVAHGDRMVIDQSVADTAWSSTLDVLDHLLTDFGNIMVSRSFMQSEGAE
jgi:hypothetical protein